MSNEPDAIQRLARAISLMEQALAELDKTEDVLVSMRLQHALDVARGDRNSSLSIEDRDILK
ncbi:MAG: hypothetical protein C0494_05860 [Sphingobium sp.]|nr:hypothetical protein [Sphingobium sp.]